MNADGNNTPAETVKPIDAHTAAKILDMFKREDENGEFWWMSDVFDYIGYRPKNASRQMSTEVMRTFALGGRLGCVDAFDFTSVGRYTGGNPSSDWRMTRRGLYLFIQTCKANSDGMDKLRACLAVLALG